MAVPQNDVGIIFNTRAGGDSDVVSVIYVKTYDAGCFGHGMFISFFMDTYTGIPV